MLTSPEKQLLKMVRICDQVHNSCLDKLQRNHHQTEASVEYDRGRLNLARLILWIQYPGVFTYDRTISRLCAKANEFSDEEAQISCLTNDATIPVPLNTPACDFFELLKARTRAFLEESLFLEEKLFPPMKGQPNDQ